MTPDLEPVIRNLVQDHSMLEHLIDGLRSALASEASPDDALSHLNGIEAIMESHFAYEERQLISVLDAAELNGDKAKLFGDIA